MEDPEVASDDLRRLIGEKLREVYPYMKYNIIEDFTKRCENQLITLIQEECGAPSLFFTAARANAR